MNILKQVIHYAPTNSVEATWVDRTITPGPVDEDGSVLPDVITDTQIRCHSYADVQMQMFRDDVATYGGNIADYEALIATVEAAIVPYVPPAPIIPTVVTMRQARLALLSLGLLDSVELAIQAAGPAARIEWEYAQEVRRDSGLVPAIAALLQLTPEKLDELFTQASVL